MTQYQGNGPEAATQAFIDPEADDPTQAEVTDPESENYVEAQEGMTVPDFSEVGSTDSTGSTPAPDATGSPQSGSETPLEDTQPLPPSETPEQENPTSDATDSTVAEQTADHSNVPESVVAENPTSPQLTDSGSSTDTEVEA